VDHFSYDTLSSSENHNVVLASRPGPLRPDVVNFFGGDGLLAVPKAVGQTLGNTSPLIAPILKAPATSYVHNPKEDADSETDVSATGSQISLISALQARNSARFTVLGSLEMLQDKWFGADVQVPGGKNVKTVNREFAKQLTAWTFKEVGVLKVGRIEHHQVLDASKPVSNTTQVGLPDPEIYRIKTDVVSAIPLMPHCRLLTCYSPSRLNFQPGTSTTTSPILHHRLMQSNSNSACSRLSTASL